MKRILLIDDDPKISKLVAEYLRNHNFSVTCEKNGKDGLVRTRAEVYDLVLLDVMMPVMGGLETLRMLRKESQLPVIMLTAQGEATDRIIGLELGADDYLAKPFQSRELLARIRAVLRRSGSSPNDTVRLIEVNDITIDISRHEAKHKEEVLILTTTEFEILRVLLSSAGRVVSRERLMELARGEEWASFDRSVDVHISHLRRKLGDNPKRPGIIKTIRGVGYLVPK